MRIFCYQTVIGLMILILANIANADNLIYGIQNVTVSEERWTTKIEFHQDKLRNYKKTDNLKLRVSDGDKLKREDTILNKDGVWIWDKILPFSENLSLVILKNNKPISMKQLADNKSGLMLSANNKSAPPLLRNVYRLAAIEKTDNKKINLSIDLPPELKNCKDNILAIVFDEKNNKLVWQYFGEPKEDLKTGDIDYSEGLQRKIITDEGSCVK